MEQIIDVVARTPENIVAEIRTTEAITNQAVILGAASIGKKLQELKELLPHGEFGKYIEDNLSYSQRKAQQFMQIADAYGDENSPYFKAISNAHTCADLSISNALRLLALPETEVESFVEEHSPADLTVKELEEKIKAAIEAKEGVEAERDKLQEQYQQSLEAQKEKLAEVEALKKQLEELRNQESEDTASQNRETIQSAVAEIAEQLQKAETAKTKLEAHNKKLKEKLTQAAEQKAEELEEAKKQAKMEAEQQASEFYSQELQNLQEQRDTAERNAELAEKKLAQSSNEDVVLFKTHMNSLQSIFDLVLTDIENVKANDTEQAGKMQNAATVVLDTLKARIEETENEL